MTRGNVRWCGRGLESPQLLRGPLGRALRQLCICRHGAVRKGRLMPSAAEEPRRSARSHHPSGHAQPRTEPTGEVADTITLRRSIAAPTTTGEKAINFASKVNGMKACCNDQTNATIAIARLVLRQRTWKRA